MKDKKMIGGILLIAISAISFGLMPIFAKIAYSVGASTYSLLFLRFLVATTFMFLLLFIKKWKLPSKKEAVIFFLLGAVGYVGQSFCYFTALNYASSSVVSLLLYTYPALVMLGSAIFLKERVTMQKALSLCLALIGAFVIIGVEFRANPVGIVLSVLSAVFYSVYILITSKVVKAGMGIQSTAFIMLGAAVVYGITNLFLGYAPPTRISGYVAVIMIALISTALASWSFFTGMEKTGPSTAALVSTLEPVVTVLASILILSEKITVNTVVGGCLVLAALLVTSLPSKKEDGAG
ncbi:MAG: DMT family transporter [Lachnospiraceae bacterium]|nr:DMT family transporter [Lachnospiraceae bacterium]